MSNKMIWDKVNKPPDHALKEIAGGPLRGFTDINPMWRIEIMTDIFGVVGVGWYYEIVDKIIIDEKVGETKALQVEIKLYYKHPTTDEWSASIPGVGGSKLVVKDKNGIHINDEALKMAVTDALGSAMKNLGVGADVYYGGKIKTDSKYSDTGSFADDVAGVANRASTTPPNKKIDIDSIDIDMDEIVNFGKFKGSSWREIIEIKETNNSGEPEGVSWLRWLAEQPVKNDKYKEKNEITKQKAKYILEANNLDFPF